MSQALTVAAIAGLVAGGAGAFATTTLLGDRTPAAAQNADPNLALEQLAATNQTLASRLEDMTSRLDSLERKGAVPRIVSDSTAPTRAEIVDEGLYITRAELDELLKDKAKADLKVVNPSAMATVEAVLDLREEREKQERDLRRAEERTKRTEDRLAKMQTELGLDQTQMNSMRDIYLDRETKQQELWSKARDGSMDRGEIREVFGQMREESTEAIRGVLTPQQMEQYEENGYDDRWGGRGGRGGGGGGNAGGGNAGGGNNGGGGNARGGGGGRGRGF